MTESNFSFPEQYAQLLYKHVEAMSEACFDKDLGRWYDVMKALTLNIEHLTTKEKLHEIENALKVAEKEMVNQQEEDFDNPGRVWEYFASVYSKLLKIMDDLGLLMPKTNKEVHY